MDFENIGYVKVSSDFIIGCVHAIGFVRQRNTENAHKEARKIYAECVEHIGKLNESIFREIGLKKKIPISVDEFEFKEFIVSGVRERNIDFNYYYDHVIFSKELEEPSWWNEFLRYSQFMAVQRIHKRLFESSDWVDAIKKVKDCLESNPEAYIRIELHNVIKKFASQH